VSEPRRMERGMLILAPFEGRDVLWTVASTGLKSVKLLAHLGYGIAEVRTTTATLPEDWTIVDNGGAVAGLAAVDELDSVRSGLVAKLAEARVAQRRAEAALDELRGAVGVLDER